MPKIVLLDATLELRPVRRVVALDPERGHDVLERAVRVRHHRGGRRIRAGALHLGDERRAGPRQAVARLVERRIEDERALEVCRGLRDAALREPRLAPPEQRGRIVLAQRKRAAERRFGRRMVATRKAQIAEVRMRLRERRVERQRRFELRDGELGLPQAPVRDRQMAAVRRRPRVGRDGAQQRIESALRIAELQAEDADAVERVGVARRIRVQRRECLGRASAIAGPERLERAREEPAIERRAAGGSADSRRLFSPIGDIMRPGPGAARTERRSARTVAGSTMTAAKAGRKAAAASAISLIVQSKGRNA